MAQPLFALKDKKVYIYHDDGFKLFGSVTNGVTKLVADRSHVYVLESGTNQLYRAPLDESKGFERCFNPYFTFTDFVLTDTMIFVITGVTLYWSFKNKFEINQIDGEHSKGLAWDFYKGIWYDGYHLYIQRSAFLYMIRDPKKPRVLDNISADIVGFFTQEVTPMEDYTYAVVRNGYKPEDKTSVIYQRGRISNKWRPLPEITGAYITHVQVGEYMYVRAYHKELKKYVMYTKKTGAFKRMENSEYCWPMIVLHDGYCFIRRGSKWFRAEKEAFQEWPQGSGYAYIGSGSINTFYRN
jgi:hypothetical protein